VKVVAFVDGSMIGAVFDPPGAEWPWIDTFVALEAAVAVQARYVDPFGTVALYISVAGAKTGLSTPGATVRFFSCVVLLFPLRRPTTTRAGAWCESP
jgi:hypothetical protein